MQFKFTQNLLSGYIVGLVLLLIFVGLTYSHGKKIDGTIISLANEEIPSLIAASNLKRDFQAQALQLHELYATNNEETYKKQYISIKASILIDSSNLQSVTEHTNFVANLDKKVLDQDHKANQFVEIMRQPEVDWDAARSALSEFRAGANKIEVELDQLVTQVSAKTQDQVAASKALSTQLTNIGLLFIGSLVLGLLALVYFSPHRTHA
jgi:CHASE3 domain sensor protein